MKQWEIFIVPHPSIDNPHFAVIVSNDRICGNPAWEAVNVLACQTVRPLGRERKGNEVYLDERDGLDHLTLVKCDFIFQYSKAQAMRFQGRVCPERIIEIRRLIQSFF
jgi:hypothetical protein